MLSLSNLSLQFERPRGLWRGAASQRLSGVSLTLQAGEVLAVIGSSGAGKSLLAEAILGLLPANARLSGEIRFEGRLLHSPACRRGLAGRRIGYVPQQVTHLDPLATIGAQLSWASARGGRPADLVARLARLGLGPGVLRAAPHELSGGMARRVLLAMAGVGEVDLLIADEPTSGLDPEIRALVLGQLRAHADQGGAVLLITHDLMAALPVCDQVLLLHDGEMAGQEPAARFTAAGEALQSPQARALWRALPENGFHHA